MRLRDTAPTGRSIPRSLAGVFAGTSVPTLRDFREVRAALSESLLKRTRSSRVID
jgi:hypothetical protein